MFKRIVLIVGLVALFGSLLVGAGFLLGQQMPILGLQPPVVIIGERVEVLTPTPDPLKIREEDLNATATQLAAIPGIEATAQGLQTLVAAATQISLPTFTPTQTPRVQVTSAATSAQPSPTQPQIASPTPTPTAVLTDTAKTLRLAVVDDNSGGDFRQEAVKALKEAFPDSEIEGYSFCDPRVVVGEFDLVVMDYSMANSPDGAACTRAILKIHALTVVVGWGAPEWKDEMIGAGAQGFVEKSPTNLNLDELYELIKELIS